VPNAVSVAYLIRGIPVPEEITSKVTLEETQAFATEIATHIVQAHPEALAAAHQAAQGGAILSVGRHVIIGIPASPTGLCYPKECRWYSQEGEAACKRCPEITTVSYDLSPQVREVSGLPVAEEPIGSKNFAPPLRQTLG